MKNLHIKHTGNLKKLQVWREQLFFKIKPKQYPINQVPRKIPLSNRSYREKDKGKQLGASKEHYRKSGKQVLPQ
jgi:hypothetical protein